MDPSEKVDMVLAHDIIYTQCMCNPLHVRRFEALAERVIHMRLFLPEDEVNNAAETKASVPRAGLGTESPYAFSGSRLVGVRHGMMMMASRFLSNDMSSV